MYLKIIMTFSVTCINKNWIMYKGVYDFNKLYKAIKNWYGVYQFQFHEQKFKNKADNIGDELELKLLGDKKVDEWVKYEVIVEMLNSDATWIEIEENGKKKLMLKGRIRISVDAKATFDYQKNFETSPFWSKVEKNYLSTKVLDQDVGFKYADELMYNAYSLHALIKDVLNMDTAGNNY